MYFNILFPSPEEAIITTPPRILAHPHPSWYEIGSHMGGLPVMPMMDFHVSHMVHMGFAS